MNIEQFLLLTFMVTGGFRTDDIDDERSADNSDI